MLCCALFLVCLFVVVCVVLCGAPCVYVMLCFVRVVVVVSYASYWCCYAPSSWVSDCSSAIIHIVCVVMVYYVCCVGLSSSSCLLLFRLRAFFCSFSFACFVVVSMFCMFCLTCCSYCSPASSPSYYDCSWFPSSLFFVYVRALGRVVLRIFMFFIVAWFFVHVFVSVVACRVCVILRRVVIRRSLLDVFVFLRVYVFVSCVPPCSFHHSRSSCSSCVSFVFFGCVRSPCLRHARRLRDMFLCVSVFAFVLFCWVVLIFVIFSSLCYYVYSSLPCSSFMLLFGSVFFVVLFLVCLLCRSSYSSYSCVRMPL